MSVSQAINYKDYLRNPVNDKTEIKFSYQKKNVPHVKEYVINGRLDSIYSIAVLVPVVNPKKEHKGFEKIILRNADEWDSVILDLDVSFPETSLHCLSRFYMEDSRTLSEELDWNTVSEPVIQRLEKGQLKLIDFTYNEQLKPTAKEQVFLKKLHFYQKQNLTHPKKPGFSLIKLGKGYVWHRPGTCLFRDDEKNMTILTGQDEGSYFGVELNGNPATIKDAFLDLIPPQVKGKYQRQGEWFIVPIDKKDVPNKCDCIALSNNTLILPLDHEQSNRHCIHSCDIRIAKNGQIYADQGSLSHNQHKTVTFKNFVTFYVNTAKRAFSEEGVD